jgi:hypothetical protein
MYLFMDSSTVEGALYKVNAPSCKNFHVIVQFRKIQVAHDAEIVVSHVAGTRMKAQGTDGIQRGIE